MFNVRTALMFALFTMGLNACEASSGGAKICDPGVYQTCPCLDGTEGLQQCESSGAQWGDCSCDTSDPNPNDVVSDPGDGVVAPGDVTGDVDDDHGNGPDLGEPQCTPQWEKVCNGDVIVWVDSCGTLGDTIESCAEIGYCSSGACVAACLPKAEERCSGNTIYWFDSCGEKESVSLACADDEFCVGCHEDDDLCSKEAQCAKGFFDGQWKITADPNTKDACGLGEATYFDLIVELTIDSNGVADAVGDVLEYDLHYTGTLTGKNLEMSATYSQSALGMSIEHVEEIDVNFTSLETFEGVSSDSFNMLAPCTLYWNITGVKQN